MWAATPCTKFIRITLPALLVLSLACGAPVEPPATTTAPEAEPPAPTTAPASTEIPVTNAPATPLKLPEYRCQDDGVCWARGGLGGFLTAAAPYGDGFFYTTHLNGTVAVFDERTGKRRVVADGLSNPQGVVAADGRLYVTHMGNYCRELARSTHLISEKGTTFRDCSFRAKFLLDGVAAEDALDDLMSRVSGEIRSMRIDPDTGALSDSRVELDGLPVNGRDHSPNGMAHADGWIYASIGHPFNEPVGLDTDQELPERHHFNLDVLKRPDAAGAIIRFRPGAAEEYEVFASGLRNVYGISVAGDGAVYGADNDASFGGRGKAKEELNAIIEGHHYGFPQYGTNVAPPEAGVTEPLVVLEGHGSTYAHAASDAVYVAYATSEGDGYVVDRYEYETWERSRFFRKSKHYITAIHERRGRLYIFGLDGSLTIVDKSHPGPIASPLHADQR